MFFFVYLRDGIGMLNEELENLLCLVLLFSVQIVKLIYRCTVGMYLYEIYTMKCQHFDGITGMR